MNRSSSDSPGDKIRATFDVFSKRATAESSAVPVELPETFRNRVSILYGDLLGTQYAHFSFAVWNMMCMLKGDSAFAGAAQSVSHPSSLMDSFAQTCSTEDYFDVLELGFKARSLGHLPFLRNAGNQVVAAINELFRGDGLPYQLTPMVHLREGVHLSGSSLEDISEYPRVVLAEEELIHTVAIEPALAVLSQPEFSPANADFREALSNYRDGRNGDTIRNCCNALESTIKVVCSQRGIAADDSVPLATLLESYFAGSALPTFCKEMMKSVGVARNRLGTVHGKGLQSP